MFALLATGMKRLTLTAAAGLLALAAFGMQAPAQAGVAGDDSVLLDPFDPVPQIGFHHDGCTDECGRCEHSCYHHRRRCDRDCCGRECEEEYWAYLWSLRRYEHETDTYNMLLDVYMDELHAYDRQYLNHYHDRDFEEFRRAIHEHDPHYGDADHHEGDGHDGDHHDGDHHDGDHHDGDPHGSDHHDGDGHDGDHHDGDHHDADHHDGDAHDGDHHDGDHHDGDGHDGDHHHDGQWQDHDGNWHDGPPPGDYPH